jgi:hypothetical protein
MRDELWRDAGLVLPHSSVDGTHGFDILLPGGE